MLTGGPFWIIETLDGSQFLGGRTTEGNQAALVFRDELLAKQFMDAKGIADHHRVTAIAPADIPAWLRNAFKRGFVEIYINANAIDATHRVLPITALLIEMEGKE